MKRDSLSEPVILWNILIVTPLSKFPSLRKCKIALLSWKDV